MSSEEAKQDAMRYIYLVNTGMSFTDGSPNARFIVGKSAAAWGAEANCA